MKDTLLSLIVPSCCTANDIFWATSYLMGTEVSFHTDTISICEHNQHFLEEHQSVFIVVSGLKTYLLFIIENNVVQLCFCCWSSTNDALAVCICWYWVQYQCYIYKLYSSLWGIQLINVTLRIIILFERNIKLNLKKLF